MMCLSMEDQCTLPFLTFKDKSIIFSPTGISSDITRVIFLHNGSSDFVPKSFDNNYYQGGKITQPV